MQDLNRTENNRNRDLLEVVLQNKEEARLSSADPIQRIATSLHATNGNLSRPSSFVSKRSTTLSQSQEHLSDDEPSMVQERKKSTNSVQSSIIGLGLLCIVSVVQSAVSVQILYYISEARRDEQSPRNGTLLSTPKDFDDVLEVATAFCTFVLVLCVSCLLVCSMQCFFASRILQVAEGEERAAKFLRECSSSRVIAVLGFFVALPAFLITLILFVVLRLDSTPAVTATVIMSIGVLFGILSVMQNIYHWHYEISRAADGLPVYDTNLQKSLQERKPRNELNTLV
ncbi:uncharacterized protein LOC132562054 [Ylistrum balloti]|uniref:uncharacterized protein LOC132562054 n=1 Tax=Ylistrum balloti TaxID=509963 RepID=UPI0029058CFC|nr:uncharacterized protein LOC132562054 [Ylistrum balloti]